VIVSGYLSTLAAEIQQDSISIQKMNFQTGKTIASLMKRAEQIAVFVTTAGRGFERWNKSISQKDDWAALFITDSIGSCLVEKAGDYLEIQLEQKIEKGLKHTNRFSPGYCGWNVTEQRKLFSLLPDNILGIQLSDSCMMSPIKSISGFIGIGKEVQTKRYGCQICELQTCFRKNKRKN
ncbi:MAG: methionine synthase, partial [Parabacteroides distasonis]|nr:methionine synthase [Parabacteroides distasonis]